jgi:O-antigen ligase
MSNAVAAQHQVPTATPAAASGPAVGLIYGMWILVLFSPHLMLPAGGRLLLLMALPAALVVLQRGRSSDLYWPLLLFSALHMTAWPTSENRGFVQSGFISTAQTAILFTATVVLFRRTDQVLVLFKLFLLSFIWFGIQGIAVGELGKVGWHYTLSNTDGFGGFMVLAIGIGFGAASSRVILWRRLGYGTLALGLLGVVAAFARGAVLAAALVLFLMWLRSPRKLAITIASVSGAILMIPVIEVVHPGGAFWAEMRTVTEGTSSGTGQDRWQLWRIALQVWKQSPLFGVGSWNTGIVASKSFQQGEIEGRYSQPGRLYSRAIHNIYIQMLAEQGLVGTVLWFTMLAGFIIRLRRLRSPEVVAAWNEAIDGELDLYQLTIGLELAMVGFLVGAFFYNELYHHWFYTLVMLAFCLHRTAIPLGAARGPAAAAR